MQVCCCFCKDGASYKQSQDNDDFVGLGWVGRPASGIIVYQLYINALPIKFDKQLLLASRWHMWSQKQPIVQNEEMCSSNPQ